MKLIIVVTLLFAVGCVPQEATKKETFLQQESNYINRSDLVKQIIKNGIYFSQIGESVKLYVPEKLLFEKYTSQWSCCSSDILLKDIVLLISSYDVVQVDVSSFVPGAKSKRYINAIAKTQSQRVVDAMLSYGLDVRVVTANGVKKFKNISNKVMKQYLDKSENLSNYLVISFNTIHRF